MDNEKLITELERMYEEADKQLKTSAVGYDEGYYSGECTAIAEILDFVKSSPVDKKKAVKIAVDYDEIIAVASKLDWSVRVDGADFGFQKFSPAGQDFNVEITASSPAELIEGIQERCDGFDCSEETYLWLDNTGHGSNGAPNNMKDLYEDMEACLEMMKELRKALEG